MRPHLLIAALAVLASACASPADSDEPRSTDSLAVTSVSCGACTFVLPRGQRVSLDGATYGGGVRPGNTVCLQAGSRPSAVFKNLHGTASAPITVTNCDGRVDMTGSVLIQSSEHVRFVGTSSPTLRYGIHVDATGIQNAVVATARSTNIELAFLEIEKPKFAGIMFKTDDVLPTAFTQYGSLIHDDYIHDTGGEGVYLGNSYYSSTAQHRVVGARVYNNVVVNAGWDGIQIGAADQDTLVYDNYVDGAGRKTADFVHRNGYQLGQGTRAKFYGNVSVDTGAHGLIMMGYGGTSIYNNAFINAGYDGAPADGVWYSPRSWSRPAAVAPTGDFSTGVLTNNTVIAPRRHGVMLHSSTTTPTNLFQNNILVAPGGEFGHKDYGKAWTYDHNLEVATIAGAGFAGALDWAAIRALEPHRRRAAVFDALALAAASKAVDAGVDLRSRGIVTDAVGGPRPAGAFDCGARERAAAACTPSACGERCGVVDDGCGGTLDCGACAGGATIAINCGGGAFTSAGGTTYVADRYFTGGNVQNASAPIAGTNDDALYASYRWGSFSYRVPVASGRYRVTLKFADYNPTSAPTRAFDVRLEGAIVLNDFSIYAAGGASTAVDRSFDVSVSDGAVDLSFSAVRGSPLVSAIVISPLP